MKLINWIRLFFLCVLALAVCLLILPDALADPDDDCQGDPHHCNGGGDINVPVDVNTNIQGGPVSVEHKSDSLAIGLSNGLGDVDIAGCLGSTQWATPLFSKQKLVVNWPCMAEFYLRNGQYGLAAMAICNTEVVTEFESEAACEAAHNFGPPEPVIEPASEILEQRQQIEQFHEEDIQQVQMQQQDIVARLEALEKRPRTVARAAPAQKPAFTEEQKAAAWAALIGGGEDEDDE